MRRARTNHADGFKAEVVLATLKGDKMLSELAQKFDVHVNQVVEWKQQMVVRAAEVPVGGAWGLSLNHAEKIACGTFRDIGFFREPLRKRYFSSLSGRKNQSTEKWK
jgi:hypothetical protein